MVDKPTEIGAPWREAGDFELQLVRTPGEARLVLPPSPIGVVVFMHHDRAACVSPLLHASGIATLEVSRRPASSGAHESQALLSALLWVRARYGDMPLGCLGLFEDAEVAAVTATKRPETVRLDALVCVGGPLDVSEGVLERLHAPLLVVTGGEDAAMLGAAGRALSLVASERHRLEILPGVSASFVEIGAIEAAAHLAADWFEGCFHRASRLALHSVSS